MARAQVKQNKASGPLIPEALCAPFHMLNQLSPPAVSFLLLSLRLWIAVLFWQSGLTKLSNWDVTLYLFEYEYKVPFFSPAIAAPLATATELFMPFLLIIGLGTRLATLPLLAMTAVIQFTYQAHHQHLEWAIILLVLFFAGPGLFSLDFWLHRYCLKAKENAAENTAFLLLSAGITIALCMFMLHEALAAFTGLEPLLPSAIDSWRALGAGQ